MLYSLYRQWRRSSLKGFIKRVVVYSFGYRCYNCGCYSMKIVDQLRVGDCMREAWKCKRCDARMVEIF